MNDLQKKSVEILKCFIDICNKLGLKYYLVCGSALGAVKYGGFIPWDDDIDVALVREEYELFLEKAPEMLPEHIFLQNYRTDPMYPLLGSKLRDSRTTFIEKGCIDFDMNHGIFIDVFPLDGYPKDANEIREFEKKKLYFERRRVVRTHYDRSCSKAFRTTAVWLMYKLFGYCKNTAKTIKKYESLVSSYPIEKSDYWCNHSNWQGKLEYAPKEQYGSGIMFDYEGMQVRIPEKYDDYLRQKYGDYTKDPPPEEQVPSHAHITDTEKPYTEYLKVKQYAVGQNKSKK